MQVQAHRRLARDERRPQRTDEPVHRLVLLLAQLHPREPGREDRTHVVLARMPRVVLRTLISNRLQDVLGEIAQLPPAQRGLVLAIDRHRAQAELRGGEAVPIPFPLHLRVKAPAQLLRRQPRKQLPDRVVRDALIFCKAHELAPARAQLLAATLDIPQRTSAAEHCQHAEAQNHRHRERDLLLLPRVADLPELHVRDTPLRSLRRDRLTRITNCSHSPPCSRARLGRAFSLGVVGPRPGAEPLQGSRPLRVMSIPTSATPPNPEKVR